MRKLIFFLPLIILLAGFVSADLGDANRPCVKADVLFGPEIFGVGIYLWLFVIFVILVIAAIVVLIVLVINRKKR